MNTVDYADIQGLLRFGFGKLARARYELVRIRDAAAARTWLRTAPVTNAVIQEPPPPAALQLAFTAPGLRALGVAESVVAGFSHEFRGGMAEESRARQLGDTGSNGPETWAWGGPEREPHMLAIYFAASGTLAEYIEACHGPNWAAAFESVIALDTSDLDEHEPFGFADGISQPQIDWEQRREPTHAEYAFTNVVALGEFLLGYPNEYGKITDRPLLAADTASAGLLDALEAPGRKDLGRNGTYLVMRQLEQDVRTFWQYLDQQAGGDAAERERLAAALVGRTRAGDPLVPLSEKAIPGIKPGPNQFNYDADPAGARCPFGAHLRRANPRNADYPERPVNLLRKLLIMLGFGSNEFRSDLMSSVRFHRILRRGREYGPGLLPEEALAPGPPEEEKRGLHFLCLNANISRQFEFLQNAWIAGTKFSGLTGESDPLLGNRQPIPGWPVTSDFNLQADGGLRQRLTGLPQFVTVRGGAYFFLPSLRALRYFAGQGS